MFEIKQRHVFYYMIGNVVEELRTVTGWLLVSYQSLTRQLPVGQWSVNGHLTPTVTKWTANGQFTNGQLPVSEQSVARHLTPIHI